MKRLKKRDPLPGKNATRQEVAEFWDTHSFADYLDALKPVKVKFAKDLSSGMTVRFDEETMSKLRNHAQKKKGIGPTTLVRMWVREKLQLHI